MEPDDNPLRHLLTEHIDANLTHLRCLSDRDLTTAVMGVLADPPRDPADSFVLHAPLELMARAELLANVEPTARDLVRRRIVEIATKWNACHPHLGDPGVGAAVPLPTAIVSGDLDATDRAAVDLAAHASVDQLIGLAADNLLTYLGGAGHLSIYLDQLSRIPRPPLSALAMSRALMRDLARHPGRMLQWIDEPAPARKRPNGSLTRVLASPPSAGDPGSIAIYPTMHLVDASGLAAELLAGPVAQLPLDEARRQLLRIAAMSMLQDDPSNAPSGWSHCLTMPQAALAIAPRASDPRRAVAIAATYVLGFRATQSKNGIDLDWQPPRPRNRHGLFDDDAEHAVAVAWYADDPDDVARQLATHAAAHDDAHLAKYTLACLHAAHDDPSAAALYRAASARLAIWWRDSDRTTTSRARGGHDKA